MKRRVKRSIQWTGQEPTDYRERFHYSLLLRMATSILACFLLGSFVLTILEHQFDYWMLAPAAIAILSTTTALNLWRLRIAVSTTVFEFRSLFRSYQVQLSRVKRIIWPGQQFTNRNVITLEESDGRRFSFRISWYWQHWLRLYYVLKKVDPSES